jgi:hypothetical protein
LFLRIMDGRNSFTVQKCEIMLIWKILVTHSLLVSRMECGWPTPALLMRMLGSPSSARTNLAASAMDDGDVTSHRT